MYHEWRAYRHSCGFAFIQCDLEDKATITVDSLKYALCRFITEVKKVNGQDFPCQTLYHIVVCIQFHLECLGFAFKTINDPAFRDLKFMLDNTMKARVSQGVGLTVKQSEIITAMDEDLLWSLDLLGTSNPDQLLNTIIFCVGKGFALRAGKEHRALRTIPFQSQFKFMRDPDGEIFLRYTEDVGLKTNKGGLKHRNIEAKTVDLYASLNCDRCPLHAIIKYLTLLPRTEPAVPFTYSYGKNISERPGTSTDQLALTVHRLQSAVCAMRLAFPATTRTIPFTLQWPQRCTRRQLMSRS